MATIKKLKDIYEADIEKNKGAIVKNVADYEGYGVHYC
jgi:hypothetical protein